MTVEDLMAAAFSHGFKFQIDSKMGGFTALPPDGSKKSYDVAMSLAMRWREIYPLLVQAGTGVQ